jgi:hypothetical protein
MSIVSYRKENEKDGTGRPSKRVAKDPAARFGTGTWLGTLGHGEGSVTLSPLLSWSPDWGWTAVPFGGG